jgi:hypothetical protein
LKTGKFLKILAKHLGFLDPNFQPSEHLYSLAAVTRAFAVNLCCSVNLQRYIRTGVKWAAVIIKKTLLQLLIFIRERLEPLLIICHGPA